MKVGPHRLSSPHLLGIREMSVRDMELVLETADSFKEVLARPIAKVPSLQGITVANMFFENSTRTRVSFELAEKRLSADVIQFSAQNSSATKGESLLDMVQNIIHMRVDMVVLRHPHPGAVHFLAQKIKAHLINAGDGTHEHPTQALLDAYSLREKWGNLKNRRILILGDVLHSRVALSSILCLRKLGAKVKICAPLFLIPPGIQQLDVEVEPRLEKALSWCEAVNVLRLQHERQRSLVLPSLREYAMYYGLKRAMLEKIGKTILILHPGPINRGIEIETEVADAPQSLILRQVENGVAIRMAVLYLLSSASR
ncbi:MAG: aspartate carbamoyltransferase catalytic subunit [Cytophagales bacterium]|nr:aspartate carbamoyltransferase catalytic subunit [Cytophagales bacterium]